MNPLGFLSDILARFSTPPVWAQLLTKATLLLAVAWLVHFSLAQANPRWRTLLWRGAAVGLLLMAVWFPRLPGLAIHVPAPQPIAAQPATAESAAIEPVATKSPSLDPPFAAEPEPASQLRAVQGTNEVPAAAVTSTTARHDPVAVHPEAAEPVRSLAPPLSWPVTLLGVWALGAALLVLRLAIGFAGLKKLLRNSQVLPDELVAEVGRIAAALGCRRDVQVRSSWQIAVPFMCGMRRPVLVLPERMCLPDYRRQLPGVIAHELAHVVSNDFAWNMGLCAASILLWFHPLTWRIGSTHRAACDAVCDAVAASYLGDAAGYCRTLAEVALAGTAPLPALGLAMARTCDVRRRIAALEQGVFAGALSRRALAVAALAGLLSSALLASTRLVRADPPVQAASTAKSQAKDLRDDADKADAATFADTKAETVPNSQPESMSAEAFGRISAAEQRALLVRVYRRRLEQAENLFFEVDETWKWYENDHGHAGKPRKINPSSRRHNRHWWLGDSFRYDNDGFKNVGDAEPSSTSSYALNAVEGVARNTSFDRTGKRPPHGQVQYPFADDHDGDYVYWFVHKGREPDRYRGEYLFPYLIDHKDQFEIKAPFDGGKVQLTVPWQPSWAKIPGGKRVYVLDPEKAFLPIRCDSRWDEPAKGGRKPTWRIERFEVHESRLVGGVWLPMKLTNETAASTVSDLISASELKVLRVEPGAVKPGDLFLPFTAGMHVEDTIEGVTYVADAQGNAVDPKLLPNWMSQPPEGWSKRASSMFSTFSPTDRLKLDTEKKSLDEKNGQGRRAFETALKVIRSSAPLDERVEAGLNVLRVYPTEIDRDFKPWASVIRALIELGKPAVPKLTAELDRTEQDKMLRDLGFVLRGIGDPRAAPALIRAIPRMAQPSGSDCEFFIKGDPKLGQFMFEHDHDYRGKPGQSPAGEIAYFSYGRPIYEIMPALQKLVGGFGGWRELRFVNNEGGREQMRLQRRLFLQLAERWADWWSKNWPKHVKNEEEAQLGRTADALRQYSRSLAATSHQPDRSIFPCGPNVVVERGSQNGWTPSFDERPADAFWDLDTGRLPNPPANLVKTSSGHEPSKQLLAWAEAEGVNLVTVKIRASDGKWSYAFKPLGMKVWRIENTRFANLEKELHESRKLLLPAPWEGLLAPIDEKTGMYDDKLTVSFLFITKEGTCGALQIVPPLSGEFGTNAYTSAGLHCTFIYAKDAER